MGFLVISLYTKQCKSQNRLAQICLASSRRTTTNRDCLALTGLTHVSPKQAKLAKHRLPRHTVPDHAYPSKPGLPSKPCSNKPSSPYRNEPSRACQTQRYPNKPNRADRALPAKTHLAVPNPCVPSPSRTCATMPAEPRRNKPQRTAPTGHCLACLAPPGRDWPECAAPRLPCQNLPQRTSPGQTMPAKHNLTRPPLD